MHPVVQPSVVSLFAGIGGFDLGFARAGCRIVGHVERDANCRKLLAEKWPDAVALDDVCTAGAHNLPPCDVVVGGSPCQSFSVAGLRKGLNDPRGNLLLEYLRVVSELRPKWMLWENVPGVLSDKTKALNNMLDSLEELGYIVDVEIIDAQWNGVAQRRRRVFVCGRSVESLASEMTLTSALIIAQCLTEILHGILAGTLAACGEGLSGSVLPKLSSDGLMRRIRLFKLHGETGSLWQTWRNCLDAAYQKSAQEHGCLVADLGADRSTCTEGDQRSDAAKADHTTNTAPSWNESLDAAFDLVRSYTTSTATSSTTPQTIFMCSWAILHIARLVARLNTSCPPFYAAASSSLTALQEYISYARQTSSDLFGDTSGVCDWVDFIRQAEQASDSLGSVGVECFGSLLPLAESLRGHPAPSREAGKGFAAGVAPCAEVSGTLDRKSCGANRGSQANEAEFIAIADVIHGDKACNGKGWNADGSAYTLDCMATQGVAVPEIAGTLKACGGKSGGWSNSADHAAAGYTIPAVAGCLQERDAKGEDTDHTLRAEGFDASEDGTGRVTPIIPAVAGCLSSGAHPGGCNGQDAHNDMLIPVAFDMTHGDDPARLTGDKTNTLQSRMGTGGNQVPCVAFERRFVRTTGGQPNDSGVHPRLKAGVNNGDGAPCVAFSCKDADIQAQPAHAAMQVRRLTPREAERLQGFQWRCSPTDHEAWQDELGRWWSPDYTADFSDSVRYRMLGNAVCVNVAEWIAKRLVKEVRRDQA